MGRKCEVLTREDNDISVILTERAAAQEDHPPISERKMPVNTTEQTWILEVGEKTRASRTTPKLVSTLVELANTLVEFIKWMNHPGSGRIDDSYPEPRHIIPHNLRIKGMPWELL